MKMRLAVLVAVALSLFLVIRFYRADPPSGPVDLGTYDFGQVLSGSTFDGTLTYLNETESTLAIGEASTDCGCITIGDVPVQVEKGSTLSVPITIDTHGIVGDVSQDVVIAMGPGSTEARFHVIGPPRIDPYTSVIVVPKGENSFVADARLSLPRLSDSTPTITSEHDAKASSVEVFTERLPEEGGNRIRFSVSLTGEFPPESTKDNFVVFFKISGLPEELPNIVPLAVRIEREKYLTSSPSVLWIG